jgi:sterol 3beta-glucosyltransferase
MPQTWAAEKLNLIAVSPLICQAPPDWEARHKVCGFLNPPGELLSDDVSRELDDFLSAGPAPVYMTFGSMMINSPVYLREIAAIWDAAVRLAGCRAVLQLPWGEYPELADRPDVLVVRRAPYKKVFPRCAMVIHHGGAGTTQSALLAGRPSIIVAHVSDQFFWGSELERLGVGGRTLRRKGLTARVLAHGIRRVLADPTMAGRAAAIGDKMSTEDGVARAIERIDANLLVR